MEAPLVLTRAASWLLWIVLAMTAADSASIFARQAPYMVVSVDARKPVPVRTINGVEMIALDQAAPVFGMALREDALAGALSVSTARQTILLTAGQPAVSIAGRIVSLSSAVAKEGRSWYVPLDFFTRALAPAAGLKIEWRAASRAFILGDVKWPQVSVRLERQGAGVRVSGDVQPATAFRLSREGNKVIARLDATALDFSLAGAAAGELVASVRADGAAIVIDLGRSAAIVRPADDGSTHFTVDVAPTPRPGQAEPPPDVRENGIKVVAIDAGHGGEDAGAKSADGAAEKDITLALARKLKTAIESKLGLRVVMTRDGDDTLPLDRRTALINNSQSDVVISLHADAAFRPTVAGARVLTLAPDDYQRRLPAGGAPAVSVPVAGGGTRTLDIVPWDLAQLPHVAQSTAFAQAVEARLREHSVPMRATAQDALPLRLLAGANMPAILLEAGVLTNADDAAALAAADRPTAIVDALIAALTDLRRSATRGGGQ